MNVYFVILEAKKRKTTQPRMIKSVFMFLADFLLHNLFMGFYIFEVIQHMQLFLFSFNMLQASSPDIKGSSYIIHFHFNGCTAHYHRITVWFI